MEFPEASREVQSSYPNQMDSVNIGHERTNEKQDSLWDRVSDAFSSAITFIVWLCTLGHYPKSPKNVTTTTTVAAVVSNNAGAAPSLLVRARRSVLGAFREYSDFFWQCVTRTDDSKPTEAEQKYNFIVQFCGGELEGESYDLTTIVAANVLAFSILFNQSICEKSDLNSDLGNTSYLAQRQSAISQIKTLARDCLPSSLTEVAKKEENWEKVRERVQRALQSVKKDDEADIQCNATTKDQFIKDLHQTWMPRLKDAFTDVHMVARECYQALTQETLPGFARVDDPL